MRHLYAIAVALLVWGSARGAHASPLLELTGGFGGSQALQALAVWSFRRIRHRALLDEMWVLRENLTAYDAAYVATAIRYRATVFTIDGPLTRMPKPPVQIVHLR